MIMFKHWRRVAADKRSTHPVLARVEEDREMQHTYNVARVGDATKRVKWFPITSLSGSLVPEERFCACYAECTPAAINVGLECAHPHIINCVGQLHTRPNLT